MGERFRKVDPRIWNDERFCALTDDSQLAFLFVLSHPALTALGAMRATADGLAAEKGWQAQRMRRALLELQASSASHEYPMVVVGPLIVALPRFLRYNPPNGPNSVTAAWPAALQLLPECAERHRVVERALACIASLSEPMRTSPGVQAAADTMRHAIRHAIPDAIRHAKGYGIPDAKGEPSPILEIGAGAGAGSSSPDPLLPGMASPMPSGMPSSSAAHVSARATVSPTDRRVDAVFEAHCRARTEFYRRRNGASPQRPTLTPALRQLIAEQMLIHDAPLLAGDFETWRTQSATLAAGIGIFYDPFLTGQDPSSNGKLFIEPDRPWRQQRDKPDPVARFSQLCFERRATVAAQTTIPEVTP
jgi:hypothetical protein